MEVIGGQARTERARNIASTLFAGALIIGMLYYGRLFFITLVTSVMFAFILEPLVGWLMRLRLPRGAASFLACSMALLALYLAGLGLYTQAVRLVAELPTYSQRINELVDAATAQIEAIEKSAQDILAPKRVRQGEPSAQQQPAAAQPSATVNRKRRSAEPPLPPPIQEVRIRPEPASFVSMFYDYLKDVYDILLMASFVPFLVYFMLSWRDHVRRAWLSMYEGEKRDTAAKIWESIADVARAYVVGNFILGLLLSVVSGLFFLFVKLPYWQLVGPISGFLSLIPYIGLPLSIIPAFFVALPVYSKLTAYVIIGSVVALFHLLALNLLYPKMVGARVHLNPLVVTVALMLWYLLWGGAGLVLAIPITAGMKSVFDNVPSMKGYGRLLGD